METTNEITSLRQVNVKGISKDLNIGLEQARSLVFGKIFSSNVDKSLAIGELLGFIKNFDQAEDAYFLLWGIYKKHLRVEISPRKTEYLLLQKKVVEKWVSLAKPLLQNLRFTDKTILQIYLELDDDPLAGELKEETHKEVQRAIDQIVVFKTPKKLISLKQLWLVIAPSDNLRWTTRKSISNSERGYESFGTSLWDKEYEIVDKIWKDTSEQAFASFKESNYFTKDFLLSLSNLHHSVDIYGHNKVSNLVKDVIEKALQKVSDPKTALSEVVKITRTCKNDKIYNIARERVISAYIT